MEIKLISAEQNLQMFLLSGFIATHICCVPADMRRNETRQWDHHNETRWPADNPSLLKIASLRPVISSDSSSLEGWIKEKTNCTALSQISAELCIIVLHTFKLSKGVATPLSAFGRGIILSLVDESKICYFCRSSSLLFLCKKKRFVNFDDFVFSAC